jgi:COP9 signalosome complex subunit 1
MNMCQARACLQLQSYSQLLTHVARAEQQPDLDAGLANQLKCWAALSHMSDRKYKVAARRFLEVRLDKLPSTLNQTIAVNDIAKYATLMALAEFDRSELNSRVLSNADFGLFLEQEPIMLDLAKSFYESRYGQCMAILNQIVPDLRLDIRIGDHIDILAKNIRARALIQYFTPFSSVDMVEMAKAFDISVPALEKDLAELIVAGSISARIDSHNKRLFATESDQRTATFDKSYDAGDAFRSQTMAMLLRINLIRHGFVVKGGKGQGLGPGAEFMDIPGFAMNLGMAMRGHKGR